MHKKDSIKNLAKAKEVCLELLKELKNNKIDVSAIYFGEEVNYGPDGDEETAYNKAVFISKNYFDKEYMKTYTIIRKIEEKHENEGFNIGFTSMSNSKSLNENALLADGYIHRYKSNKWETNKIDLTGKIVKTKWA